MTQKRKRKGFAVRHATKLRSSPKRNPPIVKLVDRYQMRNALEIAKARYYQDALAKPEFRDALVNLVADLQEMIDHLSKGADQYVELTVR